MNVGAGIWRNGGRCGLPPENLDDPPTFWSNESRTTSSDDSMFTIYMYMDKKSLTEVDVDDVVIKFKLKRKVEMLHQPSDRMEHFLRSVYQSDIYRKFKKRQKDIQNVKQYADSSIVRDIVHDLPNLEKQLSCATDTVEHTLLEMLKRIREGKSHVTTSSTLNLSTIEYETFCVRLEFLEADVDKGGWYDFALELINLTNDDLRLMEEFSAHYKILAVEILLQHWKNLEALNSEKLKALPTKENMKRTLKKMSKINLLNEMGWLSD